MVKATHIGTCRQRADCFPAGPSAVSWQSAGPDVTVVVPAPEKKVLSQEMDLLKRGKDKKKPFLVKQKNIVSSARLLLSINRKKCLFFPFGGVTRKQDWIAC